MLQRTSRLKSTFEELDFGAPGRKPTVSFLDEKSDITTKRVKFFFKILHENLYKTFNFPKIFKFFLCFFFVGEFSFVMIKLIITTIYLLFSLFFKSTYYCWLVSLVWLVGLENYARDFLGDNTGESSSITRCIKMIYSFFRFKYIVLIKFSVFQKTMDERSSKIDGDSTKIDLGTKADLLTQLALKQLHIDFLVFQQYTQIVMQ